MNNGDQFLLLTIYHLLDRIEYIIINIILIDINNKSTKVNTFYIN